LVLATLFALICFTLQVTRHMIGRVMTGARSWISEIGTLDSLGLKPAPDLEFMAKAILLEVNDPALAAGYGLSSHNCLPRVPIRLSLSIDTAHGLKIWVLT
jgi:hypothetical protein